MQTSFLDTPPSSPSSGIPTPAQSCESGPQMDGSPACQCTREMCGCSTHPNTRDEWIASQQASLARILASPEMALASMASEAACIVKSCESLTWYDPSSCSWKTRQQSLVTDWEPYSETWPRAGTMVGGQSWPLLTWVRPISASDGGACSGETRMVGSRLCVLPTPIKSEISTDSEHLEGRLEKHGRVSVTLACYVMLPTPTKTTAKQGANSMAGGSSKGRPLLHKAALTWPTPCAGDYRTGYSAEGLAKQLEKRSKPLRDMAATGGQLNPPWVAWLMGWPLGHTKLRAWVTAKSRSVRRRRGKSSEAHK